METKMKNNEKMIIFGKYNINYFKQFLNDKIEVYSDSLAIANIADIKDEASNLGFDPETLDNNIIRIDNYKFNQAN